MEIVRRYLPVHYVPPMSLLAGETYIPAQPDRLPPAPEPPQDAQPEFAVAGLPQGQILQSQDEHQLPQEPASSSEQSAAQDDAQTQSAPQEPGEWDCVD